MKFKTKKKTDIAIKTKPARKTIKKEPLETTVDKTSAPAITTETELSEEKSMKIITPSQDSTEQQQAIPQAQATNTQPTEIEKTLQEPKIEMYDVLATQKFVQPTNATDINTLNEAAQKEKTEDKPPEADAKNIPVMKIEETNEELEKPAAIPNAKEFEKESKLVKETGNEEKPNEKEESEEESKKSSWDEEDDISPSEKKGKKILAIGVIILVLVLIITGVLLFLFLGQGKRFIAQQPTTTTTTTTKAAEKAINKSEWTLEVLNGSGVAGSAAKAAEDLTTQGYTIIETGNADNQGYATSELYVAQNMQSKAHLLIEDLKGTYGFTKTSGVLTDSTASARIILGKE